MGGRRVGPGVAQRPKTGLPVRDGGENVEKVAGGPSEAVEARHHHHVVGSEPVERPTKLRAVGLGPACCLPIDLFGSGGLKLLDLSVHALAVRRYPCIPVNHGTIMHRNYATKKPFVLKALASAQNS